MAASEDFTPPDDAPRTAPPPAPTPGRGRRVFGALIATAHVLSATVQEPGTGTAVRGYFRALARNARESPAEDVALAFVTSLVEAVSNFTHKVSTLLEESASKGK